MEKQGGGKPKQLARVTIIYITKVFVYCFYHVTAAAPLNKIMTASKCGLWLQLREAFKSLGGFL